MTSFRTVSVVIPVYNRADLMPAVLRALLNQDSPVEIIIVDDGSTDNTAEAVKEFPVKYIYQTNGGPAKARNIGFKEASGDIVAFTDSDCIASPDWITRLLEGFDTPETGAVAGSYDIANPDSIMSRLIHEEIKWRHSMFGKYVRALGSYNFAVRREVFEAIGGFDETYRAASGEDNDLSYRILRAGFRIRFNPEALVAHHHTERFFKYMKEQHRHAYWRMKIYQDHPDMMKGDDYTLLKDALEMVFAALAVLLIPLVFTKYAVLFHVFIVIFMLIELPHAMQIAMQLGSPGYLAGAPLCFCRSFARMTGMLRGMLRFGLPPFLGFWPIVPK